MPDVRENRVKFGLKNCHYARAVLDPETNEVSYGTPVPMPGAVSLMLDPEGEEDPFFADDIVFYTNFANSGYAGELEVALVPDRFHKEILKELEDTNGVLIEDSSAETEHFALLFEFSGDQKKIRHCMFYCSAARPTIRGRTVERTKKVQTEKLQLSATPLPNGVVKIKTGINTSEEVYDAWFDEVYEPELPEEDDGDGGDGGDNNGGSGDSGDGNGGSGGSGDDNGGSGGSGDGNGGSGDIGDGNNDSGDGGDGNG